MLQVNELASPKPIGIENMSENPGIVKKIKQTLGNGVFIIGSREIAKSMGIKRDLMYYFLRRANIKLEKTRYKNKNYTYINASNIVKLVLKMSKFVSKEENKFQYIASSIEKTKKMKLPLIL